MMASVVHDRAASPGPPAASPILAVHDLVVERPSSAGHVVVVDGVTFEIRRGEFVCLLGPSGSGKTAILGVLAGLDRPTSGRVLASGRPVTGPGPDRTVLFQDPALFPWLSVRGNLELALRLVGVPQAERARTASEWIDTVGLTRFADAQPHELSAGMRQRAALARALATHPDVVLADEPFGALDAQARELLQDEILRVWAQGEGRTTFLFVTHNVREAALLADRILVLSAPPGRLVEEVHIDAARPRALDDALISRVVSDVHELLMSEVRDDGRPRLES
jgi:NitT/TauT family transport system ATP-binding protein